LTDKAAEILILTQLRFVTLFGTVYGAATAPNLGE
jgi:hypothetical protein